jgi:hypothetical protein
MELNDGEPFAANAAPIGQYCPPSRRMHALAKAALADTADFGWMIGRLHGVVRDLVSQRRKCKKILKNPRQKTFSVSVAGQIFSQILADRPEVYLRNFSKYRLPMEPGNVKISLWLVLALVQPPILGKPFPLALFVPPLLTLSPHNRR